MMLILAFARRRLQRPNSHERRDSLRFSRPTGLMRSVDALYESHWVPAFAGMTAMGLISACRAGAAAQRRIPPRVVRERRDSLRFFALCSEIKKP